MSDVEVIAKAGENAYASLADADGVQSGRAAVGRVWPDACGNFGTGLAPSGARGGRQPLGRTGWQQGG